MTQQEIRQWARLIAARDGEDYDALGREARNVYDARAMDWLGLGKVPQCSKETIK